MCRMRCEAAWGVYTYTLYLIIYTLQFQSLFIFKDRLSLMWLHPNACEHTIYICYICKI